MSFEQAFAIMMALTVDCPEQFKRDYECHDPKLSPIACLAYTPLNAEEKKIVAQGGFRWDLWIHDDWCEYRQYYRDIQFKIVKAAPRTVPLSKLDEVDFREFIKDQLRLGAEKRKR